MKPFIFLILLGFSLSSFAKIEYSIQNQNDSFAQTEHEDFIVEYDYLDKFDKQEFEKSVKSIVDKVTKSKESKVILPLHKNTQSIFLERYFKKNYPDAYINHKNEIVIYKY